ncbi:D-amino-acid oxidase [Spodoptera frugiperda]|uniref:D-amino-acid oxidase n=1 Tax=Spodoptera frugiperda TaxID=7108 RepID=A0A9R0ED55_SPOFR|nr:D-amino-acid oxidase [Spodoptera frugiperda]
MVKIAVVGAGVNGLTCAVKIKETYKDFDVVLISSEFTPNTTGDGSGGLWYPFICGETPDDLVRKWGSETYKYLHELYRSGGHGVSLLPVYSLYRTKEKFCKPTWSDIVYGYQVLDEQLLKDCSQLFSAEYGAGHTFLTFVIPAPKFLAYLQERFERANGKLVRAKITSLQDPILEPYDVVVNCTGLGARWLVPDDTVVPVRGQITKVKAPWMNLVVIDEEGDNYIIPNSETCVLGGTHQSDYNTDVCAADTDFIMDGCKKMMPGFEKAEIVKHWVGLRPARRSIRLEPEERNGKLIIHNYGHGGSGFTLFWGCGNEVLNILQKHLDKNERKQILSKL